MAGTCGRWGLLGALLLFMFAVPGQARAESVEGRITAAVRAPLATGLDVTVSQELRLGDGLSQFERYIPEIGFRYRVQPWLRIGTGYRYILDRRSQGGLRSMHRYQFDATAGHEFGKDWDLSLRLRFQQTHYETAKGNARRVPEFRLRGSVEYEGHRVVRPELSYEIFMPFGPEYAEGFHVEAQRIRLDLNLRFGSHRVSPGYFLETSIGESPRSLAHVVTLGYLYTFK